MLSLLHDPTHPPTFFVQIVNSVWVIFGNPALELQTKDVLENLQLSRFQEIKQNYGMK